MFCAYCSCFTRPCCKIRSDGGGARRCIIIPQNLPQRGRDQLVVRRLQPALRAAITMDSWYSALRARPFSTCCPTLRTTRATRRARAAPGVQSSLACTGIARCTTHNASQRARENAPLVLLSSALRSSGATRARSLCFICLGKGER